MSELTDDILYPYYKDQQVNALHGDIQSYMWKTSGTQKTEYVGKMLIYFC